MLRYSAIRHSSAGLSSAEVESYALVPPVSWFFLVSPEKGAVECVDERDL